MLEQDELVEAVERGSRFDMSQAVDMKGLMGQLVTMASEVVAVLAGEDVTTEAALSNLAFRSALKNGVVSVPEDFDIDDGEKVAHLAATTMTALIGFEIGWAAREMQQKKELGHIVDTTVLEEAFREELACEDIVVAGIEPQTWIAFALSMVRKYFVEPPDVGDEFREVVSKALDDGDVAPNSNSVDEWSKLTFVTLIGLNTAVRAERIANRGSLLK